MPFMGRDNKVPNSNQRIAKNVVALYIRMFLAMIIGFYTSRVVLNTLGVEDYGIYGVVGGVVALLGFLNTSMSGATSRFLAYELGCGDKKRLADTFSCAMIVHIGIAIVILIVAETAGLWFLTHKLVIPSSRMSAAHWVYQCTILSAILNITQVPYNATIIAHEKMDIYAYIEILNVTLKLVIVYLLTIGNFDKLILYALLVLIVTALILTIYRIYCIRNFEESRFHFIWNPSILKPLVSFSGWDLYGNGCVAVRQQGTNFLINMFFGVALNAANTIATTVNGLVIGMISNITQAFRPVIIKRYAMQDIKEMQYFLNNGMKYMLLLFGCLFAPLYFELPYLLNLWLVNVPVYTLAFCRLSLIANMIGLLNMIIAIPIHATGRIKALSFGSGSCYLFSVIAIFVAYRFGYDVDAAYRIAIMANLMIFLLNLGIAKYHIPELNTLRLLGSILRCIIVIAISSVPGIVLFFSLKESFIRCVLLLVAQIASVVVLSYGFILDYRSRSALKNSVSGFFSRFIKKNESKL